LLDEVERVADNIAIIHEGQVLVSSTIDDLKSAHRRFTLRFPEATDNPPSLIGEISRSGGANEWNYICSGDRSQVIRAAEAIGATVIDDSHLSLDEIFVTRVTREKGSVQSPVSTASL
jgi:ABC-2 type transport system ATP-binding protein